jgi:hypothetical protein
MRREFFEQRAKLAGTSRDMKWMRIFVEAQSPGNVACWAELHMTDSFLSRLEALHQLLQTQSLTSVESLVPVIWKIADGWEIDTDSTMHVWENGISFEAGAYPIGPNRIYALRQAIEAHAFIDDMTEFIATARCIDGLRWDDVVVTTGEGRLNYERYREATIEAMADDWENDFISRVNTHLCKFRLPVVRRRQCG